MWHDPSLEKNNRSAIQEIARLLCNSKIHYRVHNSLRMAEFMKQATDCKSTKVLLPIYRSLFSAS
jgi:hypothetical protein